MFLVAILMATLAAGIGSVWLAALLGFGVLARYTQHMLSLAAGALLATAFMHLLPEAFESTVAGHDLFMTLLGGLIFFFCLTRPSFGIMGTSITSKCGPAQLTRLSLIQCICRLPTCIRTYTRAKVSHHMGDLMVLRGGADNRRVALIKGCRLPER